MIGLLGGQLAMVSENETIRADMIRHAEQGAAIFSVEELSGLQGDRTDLKNPLYGEVKSRLSRYRGADPDVRLVTIFRANADEVIILADSEPSNSEAISLPGDTDSEVVSLPGMQNLLQTGTPAIEGPATDSYGTWATGYAVISRDATGRVREVVSIDMQAGDWSRRIFGEGLKAALVIWALLGLPLGGWVIRRRQREQLEVIRNLSEAIEQSHAAVVIVDLKSRIEYANRQFCDQVGYIRRELVGHSWEDYLHQTVPPEVSAELISSLRAHQNWSGEWNNIRKDYSTYPVRGVFTAVRTRHDEVSCYVMVFEDQTVMRENEAVLRESRDRAEAGDRAKSQFLATMSHEVRTPLNGIVGFTNLLLETSLSAEQHEYMATIRSSGEALIQLTDDILDFARIESGKLKLDYQPCDPRESVEEALDLLATRAGSKRVELLHWVGEEVPELVRTDPGRLRQVLINLVNNAVKFTEVGEIAVSLSASRLSEATEQSGAMWELKFTVRDTGIGIDKDKYDRLFRPFSQVEDSTTRRFGGTGLGLAISRNLVELMEGEIGLESEVEVGSTFTFTIKAEEVTEDPNIARPAPPNISGMRLAVVAAPGSLRTEITRLGERWGAQVMEMTSEGLSASTWDTALVDLPDGQAADLSLLEEARPGMSREKMIALVSLTLPPEIRTALRPHFRMLINKPAHHNALRAALGATSSRRVLRPVVSKNSFDLRVLLVEDNPVNQRLMQKVLANLGCTWTVAENGKMALEELKRVDYHVVLMDLHMPVMDGTKAIDAIREGQVGEGMRNVWIAALTADARPEQKKRVHEVGANDYLVKPVRIMELRKMFERYVEHALSKPDQSST